VGEVQRADNLFEDYLITGSMIDFSQRQLFFVCSEDCRKPYPDLEKDFAAS